MTPDSDQIRFATIMQQCGEGHVLAHIVYQKPGEDWVTERFVEPYHFNHTDFAVIVRCWQANPPLDEPSWRSFRMDRIVKCDATTTSFKPRCAITLHSGESTRFVFGKDQYQGGSESAPYPEQMYSESLREALAELNPTDEQQAELKQTASSLSTEKVRAIHGRVYADMLTEFCADGKVTNSEVEKLTTLRIWLTEIGWCP